MDKAEIGGYLIYHPKRIQMKVKERTVYCDSFTGNQDPYVWNDRFLHSFCHATQMSGKVGHINFWVSGNSWPNFDSLSCDLVFEVNEICTWKNPNSIAADDPMIDNPHAFSDHYNWVNQRQHQFKSQARKRTTMKADKCPEPSK